MNNIKTIGVAGGIFHILVPGVFLLFNIIAAVYFFPFTGDATHKIIKAFFSEPAKSIVLIICFGYLLGVLLRILRCDIADILAAWFICRLNKTIKILRPSKKSLSLSYYVLGKYPYTRWIGKLAQKDLPQDVCSFYTQVWKKGKSKVFINYYKSLVISNDERSAYEIYAAESICRYIAGMLYALLLASGLLLFVLILQISFPKIPDNETMRSAEIVREISILLIPIALIGYLVAIISILLNFRIMRLKEVQTVFFAAYRNHKHIGANSALIQSVRRKPRFTICSRRYCTGNSMKD